MFILKVGGNMKKITEYITITELAPLLNVSRPTLYKYMLDYEAGEVRNIKYELIIIFDYITKEATNKVDIINFINKQKEGEDSALFRKVKKLLKEDKKFKELITHLLKSYEDYEPLLLELKKGQ
jgi:predicted transcriptional regulator